MTHPAVTPETDPRTAEDEHVEPRLTGVPEPLADAMRGRGFTELTSVQRAVLDAESADHDLRISSQTGSGKTVAIGLALARDLMRSDASGVRPADGPSVLVLVPTRELAMQVRDELRWLFADLAGVGVEVVMGGTSVGLERRTLARRPRVVVGTPGRVLDHVRAGALITAAVESVVLDEADRMLDMGFRDELDAIVDALPPERRSHLMSATFPPAVRKLADRFQRDALHIEGTRLGAANADIAHVAHVLDRRDHYAAIVNLLLLNERARCLIFVARRIDVTDLTTKLAGDGFAVQAFSGELPQAQRTRTLAAFRAGVVETLVSTDVAARGIDVPDIELVVHRDLPDGADSYVHRSGRTGRAGRAGRSVLLVPPRARRQVERLLGRARIDVTWAPPPNGPKVRKELRKRFRRKVHTRLTDEASPSQKQIEYAAGLLDGRDPAAVVATLLDLAQPMPMRDPMDLRAATREEGTFVRFRINWGERSGAATNRVVSHVCRRGQIESRSLGAVDIGAEDSTFDVDRRAARRFELLVARPDKRDPNLRIERVHGEGGPRVGGASFKHASKHPRGKSVREKRRGAAEGAARR